MKVASTLDKRYARQFTTLLSLESYRLNLPEGMEPSNLGHRLEQLVQTCVVIYQNGTLIRGTDCDKAGYWDLIQGSQLTGARLLLSSDSSYPRIVEEGINLMPGTLIDIHFTVWEWSMMTPLYGRCSHVAPVEIGFGGQTCSYTEQACQQGALQEMIARSCGCLSYDRLVPSHL
ncbi:FMRFamide activated amiloride sensitive sodium [Echinococcus multilocularis]|uniref:FMRFamide activated amiloride sensitive sodium n=1 Tax=Echinococcus multilocularis TaxID=6211 RepID=A0A087W1V8_ECHMU|nr:FMRFamide activated amiloride sensitive sodium [Echinococcus multilocularis]